VVLVVGVVAGVGLVVLLLGGVLVAGQVLVGLKQCTQLYVLAVGNLARFPSGQLARNQSFVVTVLANSEARAPLLAVFLVVRPQWLLELTVA